MNYEGDENRRGGSVSGSGGRYSQYDQVRRGEKEWESPFSQIFLHTKQSINRVNEKYGTGGSLPARTGLGYNYASQPDSFTDPRSVLRLQNSDGPGRSTSPEPRGFRDNGDYVSSDRRHSLPVYHDQDKKIIDELVHRIGRLEQVIRDKDREKDNTESYERKENLERRDMTPGRRERRADGQDLEARVSYLTADVQELSEQMSGTVINVRDIQRQGAQNMTQIGGVAAAVDEVQRDVDARRGILVKMDSWARLGEVWRADVDDKIAVVTRQIKAVERETQGFSESALEMVSRNDFNLFKDRFVVSAAWKDKIENDVIFLEKKVNSLQMAGKYLNEGALGGLSNMSPPRLASSFPSSPMHSDWHQVSQRQENVLLEKLESRLQDRLMEEVRDNISESMKALERKMRSELRLMVQDPSLGGGGGRGSITGGTEFFEEEEAAAQSGAGRSNAGKHTALRIRTDDESVTLNTVSANLQSLTVTVQDLKAEIDREKEKDKDRGQQNPLSSYPELERKVQECIDLSASSVRTIQDRCHSIESTVKDGDAAHKNGLKALKEELSVKIARHEEEVTDSLISHERRMLVVEKGSSGATRRLNTNEGDVDGSEECSADGMQAQQQNSEASEMILKSLKKIEEEQADLTMKAAVFRAELDALKSISTDIIAMQTKYGTNEKRFSTLEESLSQLRTESEQTIALSSKESKTTKLEIDRLKAFDAKVESDVFVMRTVISDMNTSTNAIKNSALEVSKAIAILKTENEINKMEKDFNLLKITTVQNELEESKIIMNHLRSTNNISKIEQLDRVVNLEYEISKIKNRQFDDLDETQKSSPSTPTKELSKYNDKFSNIEKGMLALTSDVSFLGERVDRLEPLELKVSSLSSHTHSVEVEVNRLKGADFAKSNGPFLSTRIDNVDKQITEINAKFGSNNSYSPDPGYEVRMKHIESELSSLQEYLSNNGIGERHDLSVDVERRYNDNRSNSKYRSSDASTYNDYDAYNGIYSNDSNKGRSYGDSSGGRGGMHSEYNDYEEYHNPLLSSRSVNNKSSSGSNINIRRFSAPGDFTCSAGDSEKSINKPYVGARTAANPADIGGRNVAKKSTDKAGVKQGMQSTRPAGAGAAAGARKSDGSILSFTNPLSPVMRSTLVTASANASRRSSGSAGSPSRDSPTRSESINNLIAKFSSGSTPPRSMSNSFIGELINNVHSDIYPYPSPMREEGQSSEEDNSHPHTTCNLNRSGLGSLRGREAGSNSTDIRGFESFRVDGEVEDSEDDVSSKRRTSDGYTGKRTAAPAPVPVMTTSNTKEVKEDPEVDFDYSHIHDKDPFDSIPNTKRTSLGSRTSTSGKHSDENNMLGDKASRDEEAFRNKIFDQNEGDFDSAFTETNPMKRKTVKNTAVNRVIMNPSKKIVLKSSVMSVVANTKKPVPPYLSEKTDSADSIPDISENDDVRLSPFTVIDERDSPGEKSLNSVYTAGDGNSPVSDFEKTSELNDRFLSRCDSIPLPRPLLYSTMDAFSPDISQVREHLRSSAEGEYHGGPAKIMESRIKKPNGGLKKVEEEPADYLHTYADTANANESGGKYAAFITNPLRRADSDAGNTSIIKPVKVNESDIKKALSCSTMSSDSNTKYASFVSAPSKGTDSSEQHTIALNPSTPTEGAAGGRGGGEGGEEECSVSKSNSSSLSKSPESASKYSAFLSALTHSVEDDKTQSSVATTGHTPVPVPLPAAVSVQAPVLTPVQAPILSSVPSPGNKGDAIFKSPAGASATRSPEVINSNSKYASPASVSNSKQTSPVSVSTTNSDTNAKYAAFVNGPIRNADSNIKINDSNIKINDSNIKITEITKEITVVKQSSIIVTSNNMEITPEVITKKVDDVMPATTRPGASKQNSMSTLDSLNEDGDDAQPLSVEDKIKLFTKPSDSPTESRLLGGGKYDQRKAYSDDAIVFLGDHVTARPRSLRHISEITTGLPHDGNKINWNDLKQNLRRTDSGRNQGNLGGSSTPPVLSFAMTDFNSSDESGSDDENGAMSPSLNGAMLRSSDSSIIPRNHREVNSGASSHSTSYSNLYGTEVPRPTSVGYSKSYSTSEDVERKHQDLLAAEKIPPYPGMFLSKSRNNSESRLSVCSVGSDGHGTNQTQRGGIATTAAADYVENDAQPRTGSVRLLAENIFSEKNIKSVMGLTGNEKKVDGVNVGAEVKRRQSAPSAGLSKVTSIDIALAKSILERDAKDDESASVASSVGRGKSGSVDSIPARGLKSNSELTPRGLPSSITALSQPTTTGKAPSSITDTSRTPEAPSLVTGDIIQASPDKEKGVSASDNKAEEVIEIKKNETEVTPTKQKEGGISPAKPKEFSPTVLRPLTSKSDAQSRSQKSIKERSTKSSENALPTPPLSVSPTPNDIKTGSASLMTYFTATERAKTPTPTQSQELAARSEKEKENISRRRSVTGGKADLAPGTYNEPPNVKPPAHKTMEKSIALMISKAAENESRSESEYEAMSPRSSANAKKDTDSDPNAAKTTTPLKSDVMHLPGNGSSDVTNSSSKKDKDEAVVMQTAGDAEPGPNDVIPALTFLSPDNVMAPLSTRERLKLKQDLLRKQRKDKEREDSLKSETASSASSSSASIIKRRKSEQGLEIQAKTELLRADILKLQNKSTYQKYDISTGVPIDMKHMPSSAEKSQDVKEAVRRQKSSESKVKRFTSRSFDGDSSSGEEDTTKSSHSRRKNNSKDDKAVTSAGSAGMILTTQDRNYKTQGQTQGQGQGLDGHQLSNCRSSSNSIRYDITGLRYRGDYDDNSLERSEDSVYGFDSIDRVDTEADLYGAGAQGMTPTRTMSAGSSVHGSRDSGKSGGSLYGRLKRSIIKTVAGKKDTDSTSTPERDASTSRTLSSAGSHSRLVSSSGSYLGSTEDARRDREREDSRPLSERTPDRPVSSSFLSLSAQKLTEQNKYSRKSSASSITQMVNGIQIANSEDSDSS